MPAITRRNSPNIAPTGRSHRPTSNPLQERAMPAITRRNSPNIPPTGRSHSPTLNPLQERAMPAIHFRGKTRAQFAPAIWNINEFTGPILAHSPVSN